jgi:hypothetical protein
LQENRKSMIELQTSVKTKKQDDTTCTRTPKPGYLKLTTIPSLVSSSWVICSRNVGFIYTREMT